MYRATRQDDLPGVIALAAATGLFPPEGLAALRAMLEQHLAAPAPADGPFWITDTDDDAAAGGPVGVAYCEPERMTDRTWNLQLIAVHPTRQRAGRGAALLRHVTRVLRDRRGRLLLIDTSGRPEFDYVRAFYRKAGFREEARVRDFYQPGDDKVTFWQPLDPA